MKGRPVEQLVYEYMFPKPRASDPQNFHAFLQRHLVLEVRQEVHSFYGHLETQEAKYPGLDYCHPTHRIRLSRWQWHRRLFRAFDALRLTPNEIASLTKWEGTKWAKERYEREQGITIRDTTVDELSDWTAPADRQSRQQPASEEPGEGMDETMAEDSDEELASVGLHLNERLRERVALRNVSGDLSMSLDEEWEQWLKNAIEAGELPEIADRIAQANGTTRPPPGPINPGVFPPRMITAARNGQWNDIPDYLHSMIRSVLEMEADTTQPTPPPGLAHLTRQRANRSRAPRDFGQFSAEVLAARRRMVQQQLAEQQRRTYSDLRLPGGDGDLTHIRAWSPGA
jgi:hypothetical protein